MVKLGGAGDKFGDVWIAMICSVKVNPINLQLPKFTGPTSNISKSTHGGRSVFVSALPPCFFNLQDEHEEYKEERVMGGSEAKKERKKGTWQFAQRTQTQSYSS